MKLVRQYFDEEEIPIIPSNYILFMDGRGYVKLRQALQIVKDYELSYRYRELTFGTSPLFGTSENYPQILKTMKFEPWTTFVVDRLVGGVLNGRFIKQPARVWFTYYCFSSEKDAALFKMVWQ